MKLRTRWLIALMSFGAMPHANAAQWTNLTSGNDLAYAVDMGSVMTDVDGYIEYIAKTTWNAPAMLPGASAPVAVSLTRYQVDCDKRRWRTLDARYLSAAGSAVGSLPNAHGEWARIGPGTVVDTMFRKVC